MRKYRAKKRKELDLKGEVSKPQAETDSEKRKLNAERMRRWREKKRIQATCKDYSSVKNYCCGNVHTDHSPTIINTSNEKTYL